MSNPTTTAERRAVSRRTRQESSCRLLDETPRTVQLENLSPLGIGIVCETPVTTGDVLSVHLTGQCKRMGVALRARVIHSKARPDGRWIAGCAFDTGLPDALVALLR